MAVAQTPTAVTLDNRISSLTATASRRTVASGVVLADIEQFRHSTVPHHRTRALVKLLEKYMLVWVLLVPYALFMRLSHASPPYQRPAHSPKMPKWRRRNAGSGETSFVVEDPTPNAPREQCFNYHEEEEQERMREKPKQEHFKGKEPKVDGFKEELKEEEPSRREGSLINLCALIFDEPHAVASVDGDSMGGSTWTVLSETSTSTTTSESQSSERDEPTAVAAPAVRRSTPSGCTFNDLPPKVQRRIFGHLDYSAAELWNLRRVCRTWRTQVHTLTSDVLEGAFIRSGATAHLLLTLHHNETATPQRLRHRLRLAAISHDGRAVFKVASADRRTTLMQGVRFVDVSMRVSTVSTSSSSTDNRMRVEIPVGRVAMDTGVFDACSHYVSLDCVTCAEPWSQMLSVNRIKLGMPLILRRMGIRVVAGRTSASTKPCT